MDWQIKTFCCYECSNIFGAIYVCVIVWNAKISNIYYGEHFMVYNNLSGTSLFQSLGLQKIRAFFILRLYFKFIGCIVSSIKIRETINKYNMYKNTLSWYITQTLPNKIIFCPIKWFSGYFGWWHSAPPYKLQVPILFYAVQWLQHSPFHTK